MPVAAHKVERRAALRAQSGLLRSNCGDVNVTIRRDAQARAAVRMTWSAGNPDAGNARRELVASGRMNGAIGVMSP